MRPIRLEVSGFTAFREHTVIDFDGCDYFAFSGPTGSGKSSLIDAMCFALYGCIPRLGERQVAPVISQGMLEAKVRLDFAVGEAIYTAVRVVRKTKTGATTPEARLQRGEEVLAGNADALTDEVERLLGLGFQHFTRCVVLPQGEFAQFLHAKPAERQDLLVQLLDLALYGRMSQQANSIASAASKHASYLQTKLDEELSYATPESQSIANDRLRQVGARCIRGEAAQPFREALHRDQEAARAEAEAAAGRQTRLAMIVCPKDLSQQGSRTEEAKCMHSAAVIALERAEAEYRATEDLVGSLPPRSQLEMKREALILHEELARQVEAARAGLVALVDQESDATKAFDQATEHLKAAQDRLESIRTEHRAHELARTLVAGEECPVCRQPVETPPQLAVPNDLAASRAMVEAALRDAEAARAAQVKAEKQRATADARLSDLEQRLIASRTKVDGSESLSTVEAALAKLAELEVRLNACREQTRKAQAAAAMAAQKVAAAELAERDSWKHFDRARDSVSDLGAPPAMRDDLVADWKALEAWAAQQIPEQIALAQRAHARQKAAVESRRALSAELVAECHRLDIEPTPTVGQSAMKALADQRSLCDRIEAALQEIERVTAARATAEEEHSVASKLGQHLSAKFFEKWMLDEAIDQLLEGASETLLELSAGAYSLALDDKLNAFAVIDNRNAGERRSARTLSGGETFLASLALALSLSERLAEMATQGARLDAIFLDEGFGTLDPETLDVVMNAIENLAARRMVGIVTHVASIADRVPVRFDIRKGAATSVVERVEN
ncbi:MAG: hypothetical protein NVSMB57_04930 [Actinomycetota bacterium]